MNSGWSAFKSASSLSCSPQGHHAQLALTLQAQRMEGSKCFIAGFISRDQLHTVNVAEHGIQIAGAYQLSFVQETDTVADILLLLLVVAG